MNSLAATTFAKATVVKKNAESAKPWPMVRLGDVCAIKTGKKDVNQGNPKGKYPFFTCARTPTFSDTFSFDCEALLIAGNGDVGFTQKYIGKFEAYQRTYVLSNFRDVDIDFLYCILVGLFRDYAGLNRYGSSMPYIKMGVLKDFIFPLPPLSVQKEIVERLEKELGEADKVVAEFKRMAELADKEFKAELDEVFGVLGNGELGTGNGNDFNRVERAERVEVDGSFNAEKQRRREAESCPMVRLGDVCEVVLGGTPSTKIDEYWNGDVNWLTPSDMSKIRGLFVSETSRKITRKGLEKGSRLFPPKSVIVSTRAPIGYVLVNTIAMCTNQGCKTLVPKDNLLAEYLCHNLRGRSDELNALGTGTTFRELATGVLKDVQIPLPPLSVQREIVAKLDAAKERCEKLKAEAERGLRAAENLRKAILSEAFE